MLCSEKQFLINPKMLKYIEESTNKSVENHINKYNIDSQIIKYIEETTNKSVENHINKYKINAQMLKDKPPNCIMLLPFVSLISFLAGYNLNLLFTKNK
jgi:hypothetical protein